MHPVRFAVPLVLLLALCAVPVQADAQAGGFDTTWRPGGRAVVVVPGTDLAVGLSVAVVGERIQLGGYAVLAGLSTSRAVAVRLFSTGDLDPTYGSAGAFIIPDTRSTASAAILPDGRVAYADRCAGGAGSVCVGIVAADGQARQLAGPLHFAIGVGITPNSTPYAIAARPGGELTIVGESQLTAASSNDFGVMKRTLALEPVNAFAGGARTVDFGLGAVDEVASAVVVDSAGRTVVVGLVFEGTAPRIGMARFLADGTLDPSFGAGGLAVLTVPGLFSIAGVAIDAQGRIVYAGTSDTGSTLRGIDMFVGRLTASGAIDAGFGIPSTGRTGVGFNNFSGAADLAYALLVQPDDAILVAGTAEFVEGVVYNFAIARLSPSGALDSTFGVGGKAQGSFSGSSQTSIVNAMSLDARHRLLVVGQHSASGVTNIGIARLTTGLPPPDPVFADEFE